MATNDRQPIGGAGEGSSNEQLENGRK